jgi:WD40 repeat protein
MINSKNLSISFSPDGEIIASGSEDKTFKIWSREGQLLQTIFPQQSLITGVAFSPDGKFLVIVFTRS